MDDKALKGKYNDIRLFLVLIPFINALNYYLTYTPIIFNSHTIITFLLDTAEGYAAWCGIRFVIIYLDKKILYESNPLKRILIQLVLSSVVGLMIIIGLTELINFIVKDRPVPSSFYQFDIFIFLIWFLTAKWICNSMELILWVMHMAITRSSTAPGKINRCIAGQWSGAAFHFM